MLEAGIFSVPVPATAPIAWLTPESKPPMSPSQRPPLSFPHIPDPKIISLLVSDSTLWLLLLVAEFFQLLLVAEWAEQIVICGKI